MEGCRVSEGSGQAISDLVKTNRILKTLNVAPAILSDAAQTQVQQALSANVSLTTVTVSRGLEPTIRSATNRNSCIGELLDGFAHFPFTRGFRCKIDSYKSVKGRGMVEQRAVHHERILGSAVFQRIQAAEARAATIEVNEGHPKTGKYRSGHAEMVGRRPQMEDVSVVLQDKPVPGAQLFALFDGHGGREAAEFAAENLPAAITEKVNEKGDVEASYITAFTQLQNEMASWCVYVGTTAVVAVIDGTSLTVANVGDSRAVICREGKAVRLTVDHKPDVPEEVQRIQSQGGFVKEGRVSGMLAVSRALGDGFLNKVAYPVPNVTKTELTEGDTRLILACDGVWDVMSDQQACDLIAAEIDPLEAAKKLRDKAFELESLDNISVIVVFLSEEAPEAAVE
jgi:serine/threonine protein phosphatase PrpC